VRKKKSRDPFLSVVGEKSPQEKQKGSFALENLPLLLENVSSQSGKGKKREKKVHLSKLRRSQFRGKLSSSKKRKKEEGPYFLAMIEAFMSEGAVLPFLPARRKENCYF